MEIMTQTILISAFISMVVSLVTTFVLTGGNRDALNFFMGLYGFTIGFVYGMAWLFTTGGLSYTLVTMAGGITITFVFVVIAFARMPDVISIGTERIFGMDGKTLSTIASIAAIVIAVGLLVFSSIPTAYASTPNTVRLLSTSMDNYNLQFEFDDSMEDVWLAGSTPTGSSLVTIDKRLSAISFPSLTTSPDEGDYLEVEITFSVTGGGSWSEPYVKLAVIVDENNNGQPDAGEGIWSSQNTKFVTNSGTQWRSSVIWEAGSPLVQITVASGGGNPIFIPLFHASQITQWKNDQGQTFANTPENYIPPIDQLSWDVEGVGITLKEDISSFATVSVGKSTAITGKIYCWPGSAGNHLLLIQAFDLRFQTDPFDMAATPISQSILAFNVAGGEPPPPPPDPPIIDITTNSWVTVALLGVGGIGTFWVGRKYF